MMNKDIFRNFALHALLSIGLSAALLLSPLCAVTLMPPLPVKAADTEEADTEDDVTEETGTDEAGEPLWSEDYYRASDSSGELSDAERNELDSICIEFMKKYHADLSLLSISQERLGDMALREAAEQYYEESGFGYGDGRDGFQMILNLDTNEVAIVPIGAAVEMIPEEYLRRFETSAAGFREQYGVFGPFYATTRHLNNYMEQHAAQAAEKSDAAVQNSDAAAESSTQADVLPITDITARVGEGSDKPAWFPVNPDSFPEYHDETAPRIVDTADLFTEEEEMQMEARLAEIRSELNKDIVVATDVSSYGLDQSIYAADFYDFNGYGIGDQFEGVVLFICMDPNDRGWFVTCTGPETRALYTEQIANQMDDMLYEVWKKDRPTTMPAYVFTWANPTDNPRYTPADIFVNLGVTQDWNHPYEVQAEIKLLGNTVYYPIPKLIPVIREGETELDPARWVPILVTTQAGVYGLDAMWAGIGTPSDTAAGPDPDYAILAISDTELQTMWAQDNSWADEEAPGGELVSLTNEEIHNMWN